MSRKSSPRRRPDALALRLKRELLMERIGCEERPIDLDEIWIPGEEIALRIGRPPVQSFHPPRDFFLAIGARKKRRLAIGFGDSLRPPPIPLCRHAFRKGD